MAAEMLPFATFSLLGGGKIEHSNIYDLWIMIYDLQFAVQRYNKKTRYTRKKEKKSRGTPRKQQNMVLHAGYHPA